MTDGNKTWKEALAGLGCLPIPVCIIFLLSCLLNASAIYNKIVEGDVKLFLFLSISVIYLVVFSFVMRIRILKEDHQSNVQKLERDKSKYLVEIERKYRQKQHALDSQISAKEDEIFRRETKVREFVNSLDEKKYCAQLISDFKTVIYDQAAEWLTYRNYAAPSAAETVRRLKEETKKIIQEYKEYQYKEKEREKQAQEKVDQVNAKCYLLRKVNSYIEERMKSTTPFQEVAELYADALSIAYGGIAQELREKVRPAKALANEIEQKLKGKIREVAYEAKQTKYRLDFLLSVFPEMEHYVFDDESLISMAEYKGIADFNENRDRAHDYLSDEEYAQLNEEEKYQLSLDRYKERHRPNAWIAGAEYEMYCSYLLKKNGFSVIENGIDMRKADMGRDIIAYKDGNTYIIQCKRYSNHNINGDEKYIHENIICQLYGTTIEYQFANPDNTLFADYSHIIPVLYTTGQLSDMAKAFAKRLGVKVVYCNMGDYPMIKCNINNGERIYHLPFDQQYWNTKIEKDGEFYAWTVQEAVSANFRRAQRWTGNDNTTN
jgi:hypothetical protein